MSLPNESRRLNQLAIYLMNTRDVDEAGFYQRFMTPLFRLAAKEVTMWPEQFRKSAGTDSLFASILSIIDPNDGHPQEEMTPDFAWFRPLAYNNQTWVLYWPELEI